MTLVSAMMYVREAQENLFDRLKLFNTAKFSELLTKESIIKDACC